MKVNVSVLMAVYNAEQYVAEAIESILNQNFTEFEFIIINDASYDDSMDIINSFHHKDSRIKIMNLKENVGAGIARNHGLNVALGKYIAIIDADDISLFDRLETQYNFLKKNSQCVVVGSNAVIIDKEGNFLYNSKVPIDWESIKNKLPFTPFFHSSVMYRKDIALKCGGYFGKVTFEDTLLWNKMSRYGELRNIENILIKYRITPSAITNQSSKIDRVRTKICDSILKNDSISNEELIILNEIKQKTSRTKQLSLYYLRLGKIYIEHNFNRVLSLKNLLMSILFCPYNHIAIFNMILLCFPKSVILRWKNFRSAIDN